MANLAAHQGVRALYRNTKTGTVFALCEDGEVLKKTLLNNDLWLRVGVPSANLAAAIESTPLIYERWRTKEARSIIAAANHAAILHERSKRRRTRLRLLARRRGV